jgi:hypothetical protein
VFGEQPNDERAYPDGDGSPIWGLRDTVRAPENAVRERERPGLNKWVCK